VLDCHRIYGLSTIAMRHSSIYGGRQYAPEGQGASGNGKQVRDLLHIHYLAECYRDNIGGGPEASLSVKELLSRLESEHGFLMQYTAGMPRVGDQTVFIAETAKAEQYLGWSPTVSMADGIGESIEWSRARWAA